jgi:hypothetical protein
VASAAEGINVKLINTDGMAFVGPGSEWFWTAMSGVVLAVTFYAIYRQLRLQASANALAQMDAIDREWATEAMARNRLAVLLALRDGGQSHGGERASSAIGDYFERIAILVRTRSIDRSLAYEYVGSTVRIWWAFCRPFVHAHRERFDDPSAHEHFEWLARVMTERDAKKGAATDFDAEWVVRSLPAGIAGNLESIRVHEQLRAVIVRPTSEVGDT